MGESSSGEHTQTGVAGVVVCLADELAEVGRGGAEAAARGGNGSGESARQETSSDDSKAEAFRALQPLCSHLLLETDPKTTAKMLNALATQFSHIPRPGLAACMDYVLLPLGMMIASIGKSFCPSDSQHTPPPLRTMTNTLAAEAALRCTGQLLCCCGCQVEEQALGLLERLAPLVALTHGEAGEELRLEALKCLNQLLVEMTRGAAEVALLLRQEENAVMVGYLVSSLIKVADAEVAAGAVGSRAVRAEALSCLRGLIAAVGSADGLAFFLPGIVTGLVRALQAAGLRHGEDATRTGAASGGKTTAFALEALASALVTVLGDDTKGISCDTGTDKSEDASNVESALGVLNRLSMNVAEQREADAPAVHLPSNKDGIQSSAGPGLRVERSPAWLAETEGKVVPMLALVLPGLCDHPSPLVRHALFEACRQILEACEDVLSTAVEMLLEVVFTLCQDDARSVAMKASDWLASSKSSKAESVGAKADRIAERLIAGLPRSLQAGENSGVLAARRCATALQVAICAEKSGNLLGRLAFRQSLVRSLLACFRVDRSVAAVMLQANTQTSGALFLKGQLDDREERSGGSDVAQAVLPRMPMGLAYITTQKCYIAVASVVRTVGALAGPGTTVLRGLIDLLLSELHQEVAGQSGGWQLRAAAVLVVATEMLFGASGQADNVNVEIGDKTGAAAELTQMAVMLVSEMLQESLWAEPLHLALEFAEPETQVARSSLMEVGEGVLLLRVLAEGTGVLARCVGRRFATDGRLLRHTLLPMLELLGAAGAAPAAAAAARDALCGSISAACGLTPSATAPLQPLVSANLDYIVDGVCKQLRNLDTHPQAPALLAALMQESGVAPSLLPLLAEPVRNILSGLSVTARRRHPRHTVALLHAMLPMVRGAAEDAGLVAQHAKAAALAMNAKLAAAKSTAERSHDGAEGKAAEGAVSIEDIRHYFMEHHAADPSETGEKAGVGPTLEMSAEESMQLEEWHRRAHAVAVMANSVSEVAASLVSAQNLRTCLLAMELSSVCLLALQDSNAALELGEEMVEAAGGREEREKLKAPKQESPALLPAVHRLWPALIGALRDARLAAVEASLALLPKVAMVSGGQFIARRFSTDAWPLMEQLLERGESVGQGSAREKAWQGGHGASDASAGEQPSATSKRLRCAVFDVITQMSGCREGRLALNLCVLPACRAAARWLYIEESSDKQAIAGAALRALEGLSALDSDVAWLIVVESLMVHSACLSTYPGLDRLPEQPAAFPSLAALLDAPHAAAATKAAEKKSATGKGEWITAQLLTLLDRINKAAPEWHERVRLTV